MYYLIVKNNNGMYTQKIKKVFSLFEEQEKTVFRIGPEGEAFDTPGYHFLKNRVEIYDLEKETIDLLGEMLLTFEISEEHMQEQES